MIYLSFIKSNPSNGKKNQNQKLKHRHSSLIMGSFSSGSSKDKLATSRIPQSSSDQNSSPAISHILVSS
jgi:hypothetical protein